MVGSPLTGLTGAVQAATGRVRRRPFYEKAACNTLLMLSRALRGFRPRAALLRRARGAVPGLRGRRRCPLLACRCGSWPSRLCRAPWPLRGLSPGAALRGAIALCVALRGGLRRSAPLRLLPPVASPPARGPRAGRPRAAPLGLTFCFQHFAPRIALLLVSLLVCFFAARRTHTHTALYTKCRLTRTRL